MERGEDFEGDDEKWVQDNSVDYKGRAPHRAGTGVWKASFFIIVFEFCEKLCIFGLGINLIIYLTKVLHQDVKTAAKNVNYWAGVSTLMPLVGGFVADTYLGRFSTVLLSSLIYLAGFSLLTMSQFVPNLKPHPNSFKLHESIFYIAMFMTSIASGGYKPGIQSFGADQFDDGHPDERRKKMSFFNLWNCGLSSGMLLGVTVVTYVEEYVSWGVAYGILTAVMTVGFAGFVMGRQVYRYRVPEGSPITSTVQVLVAALVKRRLSYPSDVGELYEVTGSSKNKRRILRHTTRYRFLDKAAIIEQHDHNLALEAQINPWRLATVTQMEETKLILSTIPIWLTSLPFNISAAQTTFFIKQGSIMNRTISGSFSIPPASLYSLVAIGMITTIILNDKILEPFVRKARRKERGISILQRIGIGMAFSIMTMIVAGCIEKKRLKESEVEQISSIFWLVPQFIMMGLADGFTLVGLQEYFYDQVPDNMRSLGMAMYFAAVGVGSFFSSILITVVDLVTQRGGKSWFGKDLNKSRLDCFYWLLAVTSLVNLCVYVYVASRYSYKSVLVEERRGSSNATGRECDDDDVKV